MGKPIRLRKLVKKYGDATIMTFSHEEKSNHKIKVGNVYDIDMFKVNDKEEIEPDEEYNKFCEEEKKKEDVTNG